MISMSDTLSDSYSAIWVRPHVFLPVLADICAEVCPKIEFSQFEHVLFRTKIMSVPIVMGVKNRNQFRWVFFPSFTFCDFLGLPFLVLQIEPATF